MRKKPLKTVRVFSNFQISDPESTLGWPKEVFSEAGVSVKFNRSGPADLVVVLNVVRRPRWVLAPRDGLVKVLQEPTIRNPLSHRFTYTHPRMYSRIFTHTPDPDDERQIRSTGFLGSFVGLAERRKPDLKSKSELVSVIASTLDVLAGHKERVAFIEKLLSHRPELMNHTFGKGRRVELARKSTGLLPYMYSIAIENTSSPSYITEKFLDCIVAGTVPLYFGATNIGTYFPQNAFIWLPIRDFNKCLEILDQLSPEDYEQREKAIIEAQNLISSKFSLGSLILDELSRPKSRGGARKFRVLFGLDGLLMFAWNLIISISGLLSQNQRRLVWARVQSLTGWKI